MDKLILTGSRGNVGNKLVNALARQYDLFEIDSHFPEDMWGNRKWKIDLSDLRQLMNAFEHIGSVRYVIHLAGDPRVDAPWDSVLKNNIIATHNLYECARQYKVQRVIFASSNHVTGGYEGIPPTLHMRESEQMITTAHAIRPDGHYATSKAFGEAVARQYYEVYGVESICLRIGTVVPNNSPTSDDRVRKTWLSQRDLEQLVLKSLTALIPFGIYYGVSNNKGRFWELANVREELSYIPVDDASTM
jgi:nucleoside-diphosphate-sugar epimerase